MSGLAQPIMHRMPPEYLYRPGSPAVTSLRLPLAFNGEIYAFNFSTADNCAAWVCCLLEELHNDSNGMACDEVILEAWKENRLHGLCMEPTVSMRQMQPKDLSFFMFNSSTSWRDFVLPCFLVTAKPRSAGDYQDTIELFWVASRARKIGLGARLDREYMCQYVHFPIISAMQFWTKLGFVEDKHPPSRANSKRKMCEEDLFVHCNVLKNNYSAKNWLPLV